MLGIFFYISSKASINGSIFLPIILHTRLDRINVDLRFVFRDSQCDGNISDLSSSPVDRDGQLGLDRLHQVHQQDSDLVVKH